MSIWFCSDHHFGHARIIEMCNRPFSGVETMNEMIIANHNALVNPDDTVWFLGDVCMGILKDTLPLVGRMNGRKILILGNHDRPSRLYHHKKAERSAEFATLYNEYFMDQYEDAFMDLEDGNFIHLNHLPYRNSFVDHEYEGRYADQQPLDEGRWLVHGHVHDAWKVKGRQINVGVDVWDFRPVHIDQLRGMINGLE